MYESLKNLGTTLVQRDGDAAHRLVLHALDTLMRTPLVEQVEELRSKHRRLHEQAGESVGAPERQASQSRRSRDDLERDHE